MPDQPPSVGRPLIRVCHHCAEPFAAFSSDEQERCDVCSRTREEWAAYYAELDARLGHCHWERLTDGSSLEDCTLVGCGPKFHGTTD